MLEERLARIRADRPEEVRALHRPRPDAGADRPVRAPVRHAELRRARRLLLGEHGRRDDLHDRRLVLGVRRPRPRAREAVRDDRHRRGPSLAIRSRSRSRSSSAPAGASSRSIRCAPATRRSPTSGCRSARAPTARCCSRSIHELIAHRALRPRVPRALHQRRPAREPRRATATQFGLLGARRGEARTRQPDVSAERAVVGPHHATAPVAEPHARRRSVPRSASSRCPTARRSSPRSSCSRSACATTRRSGRRASPAFPRRRSAGSRTRWASPRATRRSSCRSRGPTRWGMRARDRDRQSGRVPRDARARRAFERLPDHPRARDPDVAARHDRPARRLPPQGAVPARDPADRRSRPTARTRCKPNTPLGGARARLAGVARRSLRRRRRRAGAHRQGASRGSTRSRCTA